MSPLAKTLETWGTLGQPDQNGGQAKLLHIFETDVAVLRHGYYESGAIVPAHRHEGPTLVYGVGGPCVETAVGAGQIIKRRLTYHPAGYEHSLRYEGPTHVLTIELSDAMWRRNASMWPDRSVPLLAHLYDYIWMTVTQILDGAPVDIVNGILRELLANVLLFTNKNKSGWLLEVVNEIHLDWRKVPSVHALAARFEVSPQHLCRSFKKLTGVTLQQYGLLIRLDYARGLLWDSTMSISDVAAETGFADQSHLTRALLSHTGKTPFRFRCVAPCPERRQNLANARPARGSRMALAAS